LARREGAVHRATEHGRVRDRGDERHDERRTMSAPGTALLVTPVTI
jgi:hypothetical protein